MLLELYDPFKKDICLVYEDSFLLGKPQEGLLIENGLRRFSRSNDEIGFITDNPHIICGDLSFLAGDPYIIALMPEIGPIQQLQSEFIPGLAVDIINQPAHPYIGIYLYWSDGLIEYFPKAIKQYLFKAHKDDPKILTYLCKNQH